MNPELERMTSMLNHASIPEEVFGEISGEPAEMAEQLRHAYRMLARVAHPDGYRSSDDQALAQYAFARLGEWLAQAEKKISAGASGVRDTCRFIPLRSKNHVYSVDSTFTEDMLYQRHTCRFTENGNIVQAVLHLTRDPRNNDLAHNEARILRLLAPETRANKFSAYFPNLIDSFLIQEDGIQRQANIFSRGTGWYSLADVRMEYSAGIDPKDMAWIWRRLLVALGFAHGQGIIHGATLPDNIFILPTEHGLRLDNWAFAARQADDNCISGIEAEYYDWYPPEILNKECPKPATDIFLAARSMIYLLGGDPIHTQFPASVPKPIQAFLKGCTLSQKHSRPQDAWELKEEFDELLQRLWGERKFHPFIMKSEPGCV
ncbi:MAG: hypothetical protein IH586_09460 [Anaerolineaceae bacterium]|nr:hypothetical protein [Anaerolineaceae bacterium]